MSKKLNQLFYVMRKIILTVVVLSLGLVSAKAQFGLQFSGGFAVGNYADKNFLLVDDAWGAALEGGFGVEYQFKTQGKLKPLIGLDFTVNTMKKKAKENILQATGASSISVLGYAFAGPYVGVKYVFYDKNVLNTDVNLYISAITRYGAGQFGPLTCNYYLGSNTSTTIKQNFEAKNAFDFQFGIGYNVPGYGDFRLFYNIHGKRPFVEKGGVEDPNLAFKAQNIGFVCTYYLF